MGDVVGRSLGRLEIELDSTGGLDVGVKEGEESVELEELGKTVEVDPGSLSEREVNEVEELVGDEVGSESVGIVVVVNCEIDDDPTLLLVIVDVGLELGSRTTLGCEVVEGSSMLEVMLRGELVDGGFSDVGLGVLEVGLGVLEVDGGSWEDVDGDSWEDVDGGA